MTNRVHLGPLVWGEIQLLLMHCHFDNISCGCIKYPYTHLSIPIHLCPFIRVHLSVPIYLCPFIHALSFVSNTGYTDNMNGCIVGKNSLAKCIFLTKTPKNWHFGAKSASVYGKFLLKRDYFGWNSLKSYKNELMIKKFSWAKGMFSTTISLAKGIRSKTGAAHPLQKILEYPPQGLDKGLA